MHSPKILLKSFTTAVGWRPKLPVNTILNTGHENCRSCCFSIVDLLTFLILIFLKKVFVGQRSILWGHWYLCFGLGMILPASFKVRVDRSSPALFCRLRLILILILSSLIEISEEISANILCNGSILWSVSMVSNYELSNTDIILYV